MNYNLEDLSLTDLLSSVSPKMDKNAKKISIRKITKLALKKELRRSSIYDKLSHVSQKDILVGVSDIETESISTDSTNASKLTDTPNKNGFAIIDAKLNTEMPSKSLKLKQINKWVTEVNANEKDMHECITDIKLNTDIFSESSAICVDEDKTKLNINTSNLCFSVNSTFMNDKLEISFDEMLNKKSNRSVDYVEDTKNIKLNKASDEVKVNDSSYENECLETPVKTVPEMEEHKMLLDELYGHSWRSNKEKVLSISESKHLKKINVKNNKIYPKSEIKPRESITYKNPYLFSEISKSNNLLRALYTKRIQATASPWTNILEDLCDSDSDTYNSNSNSIKTCKRLNFDDSYINEENSESNESIIEDIQIDVNNGGSSRKYSKSVNLEYSLEMRPLENKKNINFDQEEQEDLRQNNKESSNLSDNMLAVRTQVQTLNDRAKKKNIKEVLKKKRHIKQSNTTSKDNSNLLEHEICTTSPKKNGIVQINTKTDSNFKNLKTRFKKYSIDEDETPSFLASLSGRLFLPFLISMLDHQ